MQDFENCARRNSDSHLKEKAPCRGRTGQDARDGDDWYSHDNTRKAEKQDVYMQSLWKPVR